MAFPDMKPWQYPPRMWTIEGYPGSGKSTFAAQMKTPILVIDADHRFREILSLVDGRVYELSKDPTDHIDTDRIAAALAAGMPGSKIGTIVVDSLSAILEPLIVQAMMDKAMGRVKNLMPGWSKKALAMRQLQDAVTRWGTDVLWIYHLRDARDANAREQTTTTVTATELERLKRSINLRLRIVEQGGRRAIQVVWARRGRSGMTIPDTEGNWLNMPAKIEAAVYGDPKGEEGPAPGPAQEDAAGDNGSEDGRLFYGDGSPVDMDNIRAIAAYHGFLAVEGRPPLNVEELRAWSALQARQPAEGRGNR